MDGSVTLAATPRRSNAMFWSMSTGAARMRARMFSYAFTVPRGICSSVCGIDCCTPPS